MRENKLQKRNYKFESVIHDEENICERSLERWRKTKVF